jgi:hypothetical protein
VLRGRLRRQASVRTGGRLLATRARLRRDGVGCRSGGRFRPRCGRRRAGGSIRTPLGRVLGRHARRRGGRRAGRRFCGGLGVFADHSPLLYPSRALPRHAETSPGPEAAVRHRTAGTQRV